MNLVLNIVFWILLGLVSSLIEGLPVIKNQYAALWLIAFGLIPLIWWFGKVSLFSIKGFKKFTLKNWGVMFILTGINFGIAMILKSFAHFSYTTVLVILMIGIQAYYHRVQRN